MRSSTIAGSPTVPAADREAEPGWYAFRAVWVVVLVGVTLSGAVSTWFHLDARRMDASRFDERRHQIVEALDMRVERVEDLLRLIARTLSEREAPSRADWDELLNQASPAWNHPGVMAIGYATNCDTGRALAELDRWIEPGTGEGRPGFYARFGGLTGPRTWFPWLVDVYREQLQPRTGHRVSAVERTKTEGKLTRWRFLGAPTPLIVADPGPLQFAEDVLAPEMRFLGAHPPPIVDAICRDEVKISGRECVLIDAEGGERFGVMLLVPTSHPRRKAYWAALADPQRTIGNDGWLRWQLNLGVVFSYLDFAAILRDIQGHGEPEVRVEVYSSELDVSEATWLNPTGARSRATDPGFLPSHAARQRWPMYGERWLLFAYATPIFDHRSTRGRAYWAAALGVLVTGLVGWTVGTQMRARWSETVRAAELEESRNAVQATHRERERLGRDLHDGSIQALYAVQLGLSQVALKVESAAPAAARHLADSRAGIDRVIRELRQFIQHLESSNRVPESVGLAEVLEGYVIQLRAVSPVPIRIECAPAASQRLAPAQVVQLVGVAREALSNSLRHASATEVILRLTEDPAAVVFEVIDIGTGFDVAASEGRGLGLRTLRARAAELGAELEVRSVVGQGTTLRLRIPAPPVTNEMGHPSDDHG